MSACLPSGQPRHLPQAAFATPLLPAPRAIRLRYYRYGFSPPGAASWWTRELLGETASLACEDLQTQ